MVTVQKIKSFFREVYVELRKVNWLSRNQVIRYTVIILAVTILTAVFLGGLDYIFSTILKQFILK
ncbi:MAG: preprotein translocase subunit SecE [Patescibacteria group bacterium]